MSVPFAAPMNPVGSLRLADLPEAQTALRELCRPFIRPDDFAPECVVLQPAEIPFPQDQLLVHHGHMTEVLERHHGAAVRVHVLEEHLEGDVYTRKIALTVGAGGDERVVEWGVVRLDFRYMAPAVRDEILAKQTPLGAILIKHDVHRRIKPQWFLRFPPRGPLVEWFGAPANGHPLYGRIGTIYCNEEPAIQLLEIVLNCDNGRRGTTMTGPVNVDVGMTRDGSRMAERAAGD